MQGRIEKGTSWKRAPSWKETEKDMVKIGCMFQKFLLWLQRCYSESLAITIRNRECDERVLCPQQYRLQFGVIMIFFKLISTIFIHQGE